MPLARFCRVFRILTSDFAASASICSATIPSTLYIDHFVFLAVSALTACLLEKIYKAVNIRVARKSNKNQGQFLQRSIMSV